MNIVYRLQNSILEFLIFLKSRTIFSATSNREFQTVSWNKTRRKNFCFCGLWVKSPVIWNGHNYPMFPFYTLWKLQKTICFLKTSENHTICDVFREYKKRILGNNGSTESSVFMTFSRNKQFFNLWSKYILFFINNNKGNLKCWLWLFFFFMASQFYQLFAGICF